MLQMLQESNEDKNEECSCKNVWAISLEEYLAKGVDMLEGLKHYIVPLISSLKLGYLESRNEVLRRGIDTILGGTKMKTINFCWVN